MNQKPRISKYFLIAGIICIILSGVSYFVLEPNNTVDNNKNQVTESFSKTQEEEETVVSQENETMVENEENNDVSAETDTVSVQFDHQTTQTEEYALINGISSNEEVLWTKTTEHYDLAQLDRVCDIGVWNDVYCYVEGGTVIALNISDGSEVWRNSDFNGASISSYIADDMLFLCGFFGPDVMVIDHNGNTINKMTDIDTTLSWPTALNWDGSQLAITFTQTPSGSPETVYVDIYNSPNADPNAAIVGVSASSYLVEPAYNISHLPENIIDGNIGTGWVEDAAGNGEGEYLTVYFDSMQTISGFNIYNGYQDREDLYYKNARPSILRLTFSDGTSEEYRIEDTMGEQTIAFDHKVNTDSVTFTIVSTYSGNKFTDTVISEISFY